MATVVGEAVELYKRFTCRNCCAIVEYKPQEERYKIYSDGITVATDEGCKIVGLNCPRCGEFWRTN